MKKEKTAIAEQKASGTRAKNVPYSLELATRICDLLATGVSVAKICKAKDMPHETTVYGWLYQHPEFLAQYRGARIAGCERIADELFAIVDDGSNDWIKRKTAAGKDEIVADHEHISRSRLRFDARRWYLSRLVPKVFGDRVELTGAEGKPLIPEQSMLEVGRKLAFILASAGQLAQARPEPLLLEYVAPVVERDVEIF